ncbi:hypothetical protein FPOA_03494 [Fusarium poae]|uniref:FAD-binding domain-containing protein n=1 Tax=Fusarium poae TaxID=36050 RepID=A0A1B8B9Z8_FUSPO|nr:hypothetical protein FPOA_03494 [Fusarium poae]
MDSSLNIAIIGGGVIGCQIALGLIKRNLNVTVFEQATELRELGVAFGFVTPIVEIIHHIDPRIGCALSKIGSLNKQPFRWVDGYSTEDIRLRPTDQLPDAVFEGPEVLVCRRSNFLEEMVSLLPDACLRLGKRLEKLEQHADSGNVKLTFSDGTTEVFDAVIGCDGIKSNVRKEIVGADNPAALPHFALESAYRCLIDMDKASSALGPLAKTPMIWVGPGAHLVSYPVVEKYLNVAAFIRQNEWPHQAQVAEGSREDVTQAFSTWGPAVRALVDTLPEQLSRWAMFDTLDNPLPSYVRGTVAVAGDAAHGSTPHFGMGAGMGVEDALVLVSVLERVQEALKANSNLNKQKTLEKAFRVYDSARRERSQSLVAISRRQGEMYKVEIDEAGRDWKKFVDDTQKRVYPIYNFDWQGMVTKAVDELNSDL